MKTELYNDAVTRLPATGRHIIGHEEGAHIIVYQAYKPAIAEFAVANQYLGGPEYSYNRMSWIKPGFLWMMFRSGWAAKENQEHILAIWLLKSDFKRIMDEAAPTSFLREQYADREEWSAALSVKEARVQWDPDHDPYGKKLERKAIQLGLKESLLSLYAKEFIKKIEDITPFVKEQKLNLDKNGMEQLQVPVENIIKL